MPAKTKDEPDEPRTVVFFPADGRVTVNASVTKEHDDGTVDILYPHPANPEIMATADSVQHGFGSFQYANPDEAPGAGGPASNTPEYTAKLELDNQTLENRNGLLEEQLASATAAKEAAEKERDDAVAELANLKAAGAEAAGKATATE